MILNFENLKFWFQRYVKEHRVEKKDISERSMGLLKKLKRDVGQTFLKKCLKKVLNLF